MILKSRPVQFLFIPPQCQCDVLDLPVLLLEVSKSGPPRLAPYQNTKTHNNQHEPPLPYTPAALPSPSMGRSAAPPTHGAAAPEVPTQRVGAGCALDAVGSPVWGVNQRPIKNYNYSNERGVGLRWPPLIHNTQQSTKS